MANSDYTARSNTSGFCPSANLLSAIGPLDTSATMTAYTSPIPSGIRIGMAAMIDNEIVSVTGLAGSTLTLGRGCCDTVPAAHSSGAVIWFFDDSFGNDGIEYGATETISVKLLPRTFSGGSVPIENAPPNGITFNWRFFRPYPPGLLRVNGDPWFNPKVLTQDAVSSMNLTWTHRDRVTQQDALVDHMQADVGPEVGTTYRVDVRKADNTLIHSTAGITGNSWTRSRANLISDFGVTGGLHSGHVNVTSVRDSYDSYQNYRIDFVLNASNPVSRDASLSWSVLNTSPVSRDLALSYSIAASGGAYPSAAAFPVLFRFDEPDGTTTGIVNSGTLGGTVSAVGQSAIIASGAIYGAGGARISRSAAANSSCVMTRPELYNAVGQSFSVGAWVKAVGPFTPGPSSDMQCFYRYHMGTDFGDRSAVLMGVVKNDSLYGNTPMLRIMVFSFGVAGWSGINFQTPGSYNTNNFFEVCVDATNVYAFINGILVATGSAGSARLGSVGNLSLFEGTFAGSSSPNALTEHVLFDNAFCIPGVCLHTSSFTPPGDFT